MNGNDEEKEYIDNDVSDMRILNGLASFEKEENIGHPLKQKPSPFISNKKQGRDSREDEEDTRRDNKGVHRIIRSNQAERNRSHLTLSKGKTGQNPIEIVAPLTNENKKAKNLVFPVQSLNLDFVHTPFSSQRPNPRDQIPLSSNERAEISQRAANKKVTVLNSNRSRRNVQVIPNIGARQEPTKLLSRRDQVQATTLKPIHNALVNSKNPQKKRMTLIPDILGKTFGRISKIQEFYTKFNSNIYVNQVMAVVIMISIFGDDFRRVVIPKAYDVYVDYFMILLMVLFVLEIISSLFVLRLSYLFSFVFFFDLIATLTMLLDTTIISEGIINEIENNGGGSKASQLGTRLGKMLRMVRLVRLLRLSKALTKTEAGVQEEVLDFTSKEIENLECILTGKPSTLKQKHSSVKPISKSQNTGTQEMNSTKMESNYYITKSKKR